MFKVADISYRHVPGGTRRDIVVRYQGQVKPARTRGDMQVTSEDRARTSFDQLIPAPTDATPRQPKKRIHVRIT